VYPYHAAGYRNGDLALSVQICHVQIFYSLRCVYSYRSLIKYVPRITSGYNFLRNLHIKTVNTLDIMPFAAFQLRSLGTFCVLFESRTMTAAVTLTTAGGGCANDFNSVKFVYKSAHHTETPLSDVSCNEGRFINKLQNGVILLIFSKCAKVWNIRSAEDLILSTA